MVRVGILAAACYNWSRVGWRANVMDENGWPPDVRFHVAPGRTGTDLD
jgi:hypothetical protein